MTARRALARRDLAMVNARATLLREAEEGTIEQRYSSPIQLA